MLFIQKVKLITATLRPKNSDFKRNFEKDIFSVTLAFRKGLKSTLIFYFEEDAKGL